MGFQGWFHRISATLLVALAACDSSSGTSSQSAASATGSAPSASAESTSKATLKLEGIDTSSMTTREASQWTDLVKSQLAPCKETAVPLAQCISEKRDCKTCKPAAEFLTRQVQAGLPQEDIVASYEARFMPDKVKAIVIGDSATRGPADAAVTVVEFADFECPSCGSVYPLLEALYAQFEGKVRFVFKNFPFAMHPNARLAAQAALAAQKQGQFWRMHHAFFENQHRLTEPDLLDYAQKAGLDMSKFKVELHSPDVKSRVDAEVAQGKELGVEATPTIFINGRVCDLSKLGNAAKELDLWIRTELELAGVKVEPPTAASAEATAPSSAPSASGAPSSDSRAVPAEHRKH